MLLEVVTRARRRLLWNALAFQLAVAVISAFGALAFLLLVGTDLLGWRWVIILPAVTLSAGMWISHRRLPGAYPTAQLVDCRLNLSDALSTALFFTHPHPTRRCDEGTRQAQLAQAIHIAAGADIREAVPIRMPRIIYLAALPAVIAAGLFALRYQYYAHLDLRAPMTNIASVLLKDVRSELAETARRGAPAGRAGSAGPARRGATGDAGRGRRCAARASTPIPPKRATPPPPHRLKAPPRVSRLKWRTLPWPKTRETENRNRDNSRRMTPGRIPNPIRRQTGRLTESGNSSRAQATRERLPPAPVRACFPVSGIPSRISYRRLVPSPAGRAQQQQQQQTSKAQGARSNGNNQKQGAQGSNSDNGEPGEGAQQPGKGKSAGGVQTAGTPSSEKQPGNGAGRDDGAKDIQMAQQLDAMGKLRVLLGKRSENITGEFTDGGAPGPQRLSTAYERRGVQHAAVQATAERDDVPLASQEYVQKYFELVRKAGAPPKPAGRTVAGSNRRPTP